MYTAASGIPKLYQSFAIGVKALNTNPLKSNKRNEGQENITVRFAGVDFIPGQFVYCDADGIIVSPEALTT